MKAAMIGDNCIDVYVRINGEVVNRRYPTGNCVDTGVNLRQLGIPTAIISTTGSDDEGKWMIDTLTTEGLDVSHLKVGVKLTVEALTPYESNFFTRANDLVELFRRIDNPYVVGMCDVVPPFVQHESIMAYFDKLGSKMDHMHIIDGDNGTDSHIMPGEGSMPLPEMFYELKRIGYEGTATLELVTGYINEPRMYAKRAIDNVRAMMAQVGL